MFYITSTNAPQAKSHRTETQEGGGKKEDQITTRLQTNDERNQEEQSIMIGAK
jgi:hypothetical protein